MIAHDLTGSTRPLSEVVGRLWDVLVVGAGPAGALAAREAARHAASVLLVDRAAFPRQKVCGGCLSAAALATLELVGLGELPRELGGRPLHEFRLASQARSASIPLPGGVALSRAVFDAALIHQTIRSGAQFLPQTTVTATGTSETARWVRVTRGEEHATIQARVVLVADGLGGALLRREPGVETLIAPDARVGVGAIIDAPLEAYASGIVWMVCGQGGYAGLVRVEDDRLDIAAALDLWLIKQSGGVGQAVAAIFDQADVPPVRGVATAVWRGTPTLTRRKRSLAAARMFVLGDAAGYVEPFTGEGIACALASGVAVIPFVRKALQRWTPSLASQWTAHVHRLLGRRQQVCRLLTRGLRHVELTRAAVVILSQLPALAQPLVGYLHRPFPQMPQLFQSQAISA